MSMQIKKSSRRGGARRIKKPLAAEAKDADEPAGMVEHAGLGTVEVFVNHSGAQQMKNPYGADAGRPGIYAFCEGCQNKTRFYDGSCNRCGTPLPNGIVSAGHTFDVARDLAGKSVSVDASSSTLKIAFENDEVVVSVAESADFVQKLASASDLAFATEVSSRLERNYNDEVNELKESVQRNRAAYAAAKRRGELDEVGALAVEHDELTSRLAKMEACTSHGAVYRKVHVPVRLKKASYLLKANAMIRLGEFSVQWLQPHSGGTTTVEAVFAPSTNGGHGRQQLMWGQQQGRQATDPPFKKTELPAFSLSEVLDLVQKMRRNGRHGTAPVVTFQKMAKPPRQ